MCVKISAMVHMICSELWYINTSFKKGNEDDNRFAYIRLGALLDLLLEAGIEYETEEVTKGKLKLIRKVIINGRPITTEKFGRGSGLGVPRQLSNILKEETEKKPST